MYETNPKELTSEEYNEIVRDDKLLTNVAFAHGVANANGELLYMKAFGKYPTEYKVTEEQIKDAKEKYEARKKHIINNIKGKLAFVGMGMEYDNKLINGVRNHRIRTRFYNDKNELCFIEFGTGYQSDKDGTLRIDHAIMNYKEIEQRSDKNLPDEINNYKQLQSKTPVLDYTTDNILKIVNEFFGCSFKEMVVIDYCLSCDDYISEVLQWLRIFHLTNTLT